MMDLAAMRAREIKQLQSLREMLLADGWQCKGTVRRLVRVEAAIRRLGGDVRKSTN